MIRNLFSTSIITERLKTTQTLQPQHCINNQPPLPHSLTRNSLTSQGTTPNCEIAALGAALLNVLFDTAMAGGTRCTVGNRERETHRPTLCAVAQVSRHARSDGTAIRNRYNTVSSSYGSRFHPST